MKIYPYMWMDKNTAKVFEIDKYLKDKIRYRKERAL